MTPDMIPATIHLFDRRYPPAIFEEGAFVFEMYAPGDVAVTDAEPIRVWRIEGDQLAMARTRSAFGGCYRFRLSMLDEGSDTLPIAMADVVCRFEPLDGGATVHAGQSASIQIGRKVLVPKFKWQTVTETDEPSP